MSARGGGDEYQVLGNFIHPLKIPKLSQRFTTVSLYLSNTGVHNEDNIIRPDGVADGQHLLEEAVLLLVPSTGVHDNNLKPFSLEGHVNHKNSPL